MNEQKSESKTPQTTGTEVVIAEGVRPVKETATTTQLDELARIIRESYTASRKAFEEFNNMRFRVGMAMVFARELIANGNVGNNRNPSGINQHQVGQIGHVSNLTSSNSSAKANFTADSVGLMSWAKKEFPEIPYRTLSRYREWAEFQALPKVLAQRQQLELPVELMPHQILALPGVKQEQLSEVLKTAVNGKDLTLTLRAMNEIPEAKDPEQNLKPRQAKAPADKKTKTSELAYLRTKASHWFKVLKAHLELYHKTEEPLWETLSDEDQATLKELLKLGYDEMIQSEKRRKKSSK